MKKVLFILFTVSLILSFTGVVLINHYAAKEIDRYAQEWIQDSKSMGDFEINYDQISFNILRCQVTLEGLKYDQDENTIHSETTTLKFGFSDLISLLSDTSGTSDISFQDAAIGVQNLKVNSELESMLLSHGTYALSADINPQNGEILIHNMRFRAEDFRAEMQQMDINANALDFAIDFGKKGMNYQALFNISNDSFLTMDDMRLNVEMHQIDFAPELNSIPGLSASDLDYLQADKFLFNANKEGDYSTLNCNVNTKNGTAGMDCSFDFSANNDDPMINTSFEIIDLSENLRNLMEEQIGWDPEKETYQFEFEGKVSELGVALMMSLM